MLDHYSAGVETKQNKLKIWFLIFDIWFLFWEVWFLILRVWFLFCFDFESLIFVLFFDFDSLCNYFILHIFLWLGAYLLTGSEYFVKVRRKIGFGGLWFTPKWSQMIDNFIKVDWKNIKKILSRPRLPLWAGFCAQPVFFQRF